MTDPATTSAPQPPRVTPTVSQPIRVDWISWGEQFLAHEQPMIEFAADAGLNLVESVIPGGFAIKMFVGEKVVNQLIDQGIKVLDGVMEKAPTLSVDPALHPLAAYVFNMVNTCAPKLAESLGPKLDDLIKAGLAKIGISV